MKSVLIFALTVSALAQLPDPKLTSGAIRTSDQQEICSPSFRTRKYRHTTLAMKREVCQRYHLKDCPHPGLIEIDHLIPLELGGADTIENLWPEFSSYPKGFGYGTKDQLENELHDDVCLFHRMTIAEAQQCIQTDWIACYQRVQP